MAVWVCQDCKYRTKDEKKAIKHSMKIVSAEYHNLKLTLKEK